MIFNENKDQAGRLLSLIGLVTLFSVISLEMIFPWHFYKSDNFEAELPEGADFSYYLDGAKSIGEFKLFDKLNNKKQPILAAKPVHQSDLKNYYNWIAVAYPNPSFKFGYSLFSAIVTFPVPKCIFEKIIPRLAFANFVFGLSILILIYLIVYEITKSNICSFFSVLFQVFDIFNIHNNYFYMSHTSSGILFSLIASLLILKSNPTSVSMFAVGMFISFACLCSSHLLIFNFSLFFLYLVFYCKYIFFTNQKIKPLGFYFLGALFWPIYIVIVESVCKFKQIGIPTFFEQYKGYSHGVKSLISTYGIFERQMWDLRLWNFFFYPLLFVSLIIIWKMRISISANFKNFKKIDNAKIYIILISALIFFITNCFVSQPIVRAIVPSLFILNILFGCLLGSVFKVGPIWKTVVVAAVISLVINFELYTTVIKKQIKALTVTRLVNSDKIVKLFGQEEFWKHTHIFYKKGGNYKIPQGIYKNFSMSIFEYIESLNKENKYDDKYLEINPFDLIEAYSHSRRWYPKFQPLNDNIVSQKVIEKDFKLFFQIFDLAKHSKIKMYSDEVLAWNPIVFDQEYNYIFGINGKIKPYLKGTSLEALDFKKIYYVKISDLCTSLRARQNE